MKLARHKSDRPLISLVPMIDVMLILLVFFMVTSTYLNLKMIPFVKRSDEQSSNTQIAEAASSTLLVRVSAAGESYIKGQSLTDPATQLLITERIEENPLLSIVILPSTHATTQHLVSAMDMLTRAGATRLRLLRLEERP